MRPIRNPAITPTSKNVVAIHSADEADAGALFLEDDLAVGISFHSRLVI